MHTNRQKIIPLFPDRQPPHDPPTTPPTEGDVMIDVQELLLAAFGSVSMTPKERRLRDALDGEIRKEQA